MVCLKRQKNSEADKHAGLEPTSPKATGVAIPHQAA